MSEKLTVEVDAGAAAAAIGEALQVMPHACLESAIYSTVDLIKDEPGKYLFDRLADHLDFLLQEQRDHVGQWRCLPTTKLEDAHEN